MKQDWPAILRHTLQFGSGLAAGLGLATEAEAAQFAGYLGGMLTLGYMLWVRRS